MLVSNVFVFLVYQTCLRKLIADSRSTTQRHVISVRQLLSIMGWVPSASASTPWTQDTRCQSSTGSFFDNPCCMLIVRHAQHATLHHFTACYPEGVEFVTRGKNSTVATFSRDLIVASTSRLQRPRSLSQLRATVVGSSSATFQTVGDPGGAVHHCGQRGTSGAPGAPGAPAANCSGFVVPRCFSTCAPTCLETDVSFGWRGLPSLTTVDDQCYGK